ncbi:uncharacterized protein TRAVEDRAFT_53461 [Trametes versicolor FP-101664 SS1]|uniref:uncharacterized protein n=1 Tax=Trametes versicolor (strain FP-101664) TaxID=717944 RepID=UPI0004624223|nr:uncharacterized protein TRAVEDRAFT_53461 [Trametes versicolor FP-101664 SS1]EIW53044.1 hypothetical protein TRAVEDRAFT_53461 [Trametes versicolor FP-101664 SS1]
MDALRSSDGSAQATASSTPATAPSIDDSFGAFILGTYLSLIFYGFVLHQGHNYFKTYPHDRLLHKAYVILILAVETVHSALCVHTCYFYLVKNYLNPSGLEGCVWSINMLGVAFTSFMVQIFFAYRVYLLRPAYKSLVAVAIFFAFVVLAFGAAATAEGFRVGTLDGFRPYAWLDSAAFGAAVVSDTLTAGALTFVLRNSRTGFKRTDHMIDQLIFFAVNTGLLTVAVNLLGLILALGLPTSNLAYFAVAAVGDKIYANSLLAVLNSRSAVRSASNVPEAIDMTAFAVTRNEPRGTRWVIPRPWEARHNIEEDTERAEQLKAGLFASSARFHAGTSWV